MNTKPEHTPGPWLTEKVHKKWTRTVLANCLYAKMKENEQLLACVKEMYLWHHNYDTERNGALDACAPAVHAEQILSEMGLLKGLS